MKEIWDLKSIREASTRSEFYQFLNVGLKDLMFKAYRTAKTTYPAIVTFEESDKAKEEYPSTGNVALPEQVLEGAPFIERTIPPEDFVEVTNHKYGEIISITEELIEDDKTNQIKRLPMDLGNAHAKKEDKTVYSIINGNPTIYDGGAFFALNHPGYTGGAAIAANDNIYTNVTLSANALAVALGIIGGWTGHSTEDLLDVVATALVVPTNLKYTANLLTKSAFAPWAYAAGALGPAATTGQGKNVLAEEGLEVISSPRLDVTSTTDWYIKTDFVGILFQWRQKLGLFEEPEEAGSRFERDVRRWKSRSRWATKVLNWRGMFKVS